MLRKFLKVEKLVIERFGDLVEDILYLNKGAKMRVLLDLGKEPAFVDVYVSPISNSAYSFHLQLPDGRVYRLDTYPGEERAKKLPTYPVHFHNGFQDSVIEPPFKVEGNFLKDFDSFLSFILKMITEDRTRGDL